ncbi:MAG TPA: ATP-binding protein [Gemmatimonadales bacterium]|nr:ATP-binding protein [Gemmatimonadales bacterium]
MTLGRLRVRLTLWYAATLAVILLLLGAGLFVAIGTQVSRRIDVSLAAATAAIEHATHDLEAERAAGGAADAVEELHIPDRDLYLFDANGRPITPRAADAWIIAAAHAATATGTNDAQVMMANGQQSRLHAERFTGRSGTTYVAVAVGQRPNIREQYAGLIGIFGAAALAALVMVTLGGFLLARQSTVPVERSMEQMRRFMADAAHELRTPVTILRTRTEVALSQPREATGDTAAFQAIERETERLGGIVGDLLTLARADSGERQVVHGPLYLDDVVSQAVGSARMLAERKGVALAVGSFEEAQIVGDARLVERLVLIVLDNAIKYTPEGGRVRLDVTARDGKRSVIVTDTGIGIPADQLPRIFERFYRGDRARSQAEGAGLGLPIARWIADLHGARISVASEPTGTRVEIAFPAAVRLP